MSDIPEVPRRQLTYFSNDVKDIKEMLESIEADLKDINTDALKIIDYISLLPTRIPTDEEKQTFEKMRQWVKDTDLSLLTTVSAEDKEIKMALPIPPTKPKLQVSTEAYDPPIFPNNKIYHPLT